jgi:hypothetical protein
MPYSIRRRGPHKYSIVNKQTGKTVGHSSSKKAAQRSVNARNAGAHGWHGTKR